MREEGLEAIRGLQTWLSITAAQTKKGKNIQKSSRSTFLLDAAGRRRGFKVLRLQEEPESGSVQRKGKPAGGAKDAGQLFDSSSLLGINRRLMFF